MRMTKRRGIILEILRERGHLDAYELLELARQKDSRISLATVYRSLAYFRERDVIRGRTFGEGHTHFEIHDAETGSHAHFICSGCGRLREITGRFMGDLEQLAKKENIPHLQGPSRHVRALRRVRCQRTLRGFRKDVKTWLKRDDLTR